MAKATRLPSGNWRVLEYSHTETIIKDGQEKKVRRYKSFTDENKKEAEYQAALFRRDKKRKKSPSRLTVGEAMERYIKSKSDVLSPSTIREYKRSREMDLQQIMDIEIGDLTIEDIQKEINREAKNHSPKTVHNMHGLLSATLKMFLPGFRLDTTLPALVPYTPYVPSDEDIGKLMRALNGSELEKAVLLAAFGSLRRSEISALVDKDIQENKVKIDKAMVKNEHKEWVIKVPKTRASYRVIEYPLEVIDKFKGITGPLVRLNPDQITKQFSTALKKNSIPHFRFHDLRHYQASILHALGVPDLYIMERGGWKTRSTLDKVYKHVMDKKKQEVIKLANNHFSELMQRDMQHENDIDAI